MRYTRPVCPKSEVHPPPNISGGGGGRPVQSPPPPNNSPSKIKMKKKVNDESPMRVVNGYYLQDDHQYTHFAFFSSYIYK